MVHTAVGIASEEHQIPGPQILHGGDQLPAARLGKAFGVAPADAVSALLEAVVYQTGTVEGVRTLGAPLIGLSQLILGSGDQAGVGSFSGGFCRRRFWRSFGGDFGGTVLVDNTVRDTYKTNAYVDDTVEPNKKYYYGIFPYHVALDDADHPIKHYRFTKVFSVNTEENITAPSIIYAVCDEGTDVVITYLLPVLTDSTYSYVKLAYKKDGIPKSLTDADGVIDITNNPIEPMLHSGQYTVTGLDELTEYYFVIFVENSKGTKADSEPASCITKEDLGTDFSYTGEIQTFTAPKTGIYSLETWGAQGGNATDGTLTARGGYGAYAVGEVFLQQGDVLYVNVGGQNGYGGGGNYVPPNNE
jgi:hypothetical protein